MTLVFFGLLSVLIVISPFVPPTTFWFFALLTFLVFPIVIVHILLVPFLVYRKNWYVFVAAIVLVIGVPLIFKIYVLRLDSEENRNKSGNLKVLSYNISFFRVGRVFSEEYYTEQHHKEALNTRAWILEQGPDIICMQEFFNDVGSNIFNNLDFISDNGKYDYYFMNKPLHDNGTSRGIVTFSKFPIVHQKEIFLAANRYNGALFTDIQFQKDTLRIINVHLASLNLFESKDILSILSSVKENVLQKEEQCSILLEEIRNSPHPVILCGDLNETPLSYSYRQLENLTDDAFVQVGRGFGGTLTSNKVLSYLRIDHQFIDPNIEVKSFTTHRNIYLSDHYPIIGEYQIPINFSKVD